MWMVKDTTGEEERSRKGNKWMERQILLTYNFDGEFVFTLCV